MVITLFDDSNLSSLKLWASESSLTHAVVADPAFEISDDYNPDGAIPSMSLLGPGAELLIRDKVEITEAEVKVAMGL